MSVPLLSRYVDRRIQLPGDSITCPAMLVQELKANHMEVISLHDARHHWPSVTHLNAWKHLMKLRSLLSKLLHLREIAVMWLQKHSNM